MTTYRLFPSTSGPTTASSYSGAFLDGVLIEVTQGGCWFEGYWFWVCPSGGQSTAPQKFALWNVTNGVGGGVLVPGSVVTSGTLTAGQWNYVPLTVPLPLAIATCYNACTGFTGPFPDADGTYTSSPITNGPLTAYSDIGGSLVSPYTIGNALFGTSGTDPTVSMPLEDYHSASFGMDVQVSDTAPGGFTGPYQLWPTKWDADNITDQDSAVNYVVGTQIDLAEPCLLNEIRYYSPSGTAQLATECGVWDIATQALVAEDAAPSWSGAAGSGWVSCSFSGVTLPAGQYRVSIFNGAATPDMWSAKRLGYWGVYEGATSAAVGINGITFGPMTAPPTADAQPCNIYEGSGTEPGQSVFAVGPPNAFPDIYVDGLFQNYWVDAVLTPVAAPPASPGLLMASFP